MDEDGPIFENSCHREFIYCGYTRSTSAFFLSIGVIISQTALYGVFLNEAIKKINEDRVTLEVPWENCADYNEYLKDANTTQILDAYIKHVASDLYYNYFSNNINNITYSSTSYNSSTSLLNVFQCEAEYPSHLWIAALLPAILLAAYTMPDLINGVKVFFIIKGKWAKFAACIILLENLLALVVGTCWAFQGYWKGSSYESIVNCMLLF